VRIQQSENTKKVWNFSKQFDCSQTLTPS